MIKETLKMNLTRKTRFNIIMGIFNKSSYKYFKDLNLDCKKKFFHKRKDITFLVIVLNKNY